jgi:hypothetical protein
MTVGGTNLPYFKEIQEKLSPKNSIGATVSASKYSSCLQDMILITSVVHVLHSLPIG